MSDKTIFSKIITGEIPATKVYEDDIVLAFLDINPSNQGHTLVIPKEPSTDVTETDPDILLHIMTIGQKIAKAQRKALGATGNNLIFNCGADGGQEVFHTHLHVVPRFSDDQVFQPPKHTSYEAGEADIVADQLKKAL
jgi:histidine triad (HIT) family protein